MRRHSKKNLTCANNKVWHKSLISKLPSYKFFSSFCSLISSFFSDHYIADVVESHCSSPKLSTVVFLRVLSYHPFSFYYSSMITLIWLSALSTPLLMSYNRCPTQQKLSDSRRDAIGRLTSDLSLVSMGQDKPGSVQCIKNSISTTIYWFYLT